MTMAASGANCVRNVLFLCTGNSARSILAESLLNGRGCGRFRAFSAGSFPKGAVRPEALAVLDRHDLPVIGLRSKAWDEFAAPGAPAMDLIVTVCDDAVGEVCPIWPGHPLVVHWGIPDPAAVTGGQEAVAAAFALALARLERRIGRLRAMTEADWTQPGLPDRLGAIGMETT